MSILLVDRENVRCVSLYLAKAVSSILGLSENFVLDLLNTGKVRVQRPPDPRLGDYGFAIHILLKDLDPTKWSEVGSSIARELISLAKDQCHLEEASFVNGYINVSFNYREILLKLASDWYMGTLDRRLRSVGMGHKTIVEHTSANPVHPLHIGSGRNSVLGDTFARLLSRLGFSVERRFYVNDLGRQMAILVYGVTQAKSKGVEKPGNLKVDHWYGAIYALTNILMELDRLRSELRRSVNNIWTRVTKILEELSTLTGNPQLRELRLSLENFVSKYGLNIDVIKQLRKLHSVLGGYISKVEDPELKIKLESLLNEIGDLRKTYREYLSYVRAESRLAYMFPELHTALKSSLGSYVEVEAAIKELMTRAEHEDPATLSLFRGVADDVLEGFKQTLSAILISFDGFDYESSRDIVSLAHRVVEDLLETPYARTIEGGAVEVNLNKAAEDLEYVKKLFYPDQAGRFVVRRSDGTTLYVTRDIAYTIYKFKTLGAERVYNVIAVEQSREQKQLKAVLYILGFTKEAENLYHFGYEMVHLKGMKMSGRRGIYYTLDELLEDLKTIMFKKLFEKETGSQSSTAELLSIARDLAVANARALLLSVEPGKTLIFDIDKIETTDYASTIEYAFVRAQGILRTLWGFEPLDDSTTLMHNLEEAVHALSKQSFPALSIEEKSLLEQLLGYEETLLKAYRELKPNKLLEYTMDLATSFNKFYEKHPVVKERDESKKLVRVILTTLVLLTLSELMDIIGIPKLKRM